MTKEEIVAIIRSEYFFHLGAENEEIALALLEILVDIGESHDLPM